MCRSSRILIFVGLLAATPALGQGRMGIGPGAGAVPIAPGAARPAVQPGVRPGVNPSVLPNVRRGVAPNVRPGVAPNVRSGILPGFNRGGVRPRLGRFGRFGVGSALGLAGVGLSLADGLPYPPGDLGPGGFGDEFGAYPGPIIPAIAPPPPCANPLIIQVGGGLRHKAKTRIVSGSQSNCGR